jgi:pyroglutamyl-peptidase
VNVPPTSTPTRVALAIEARLSSDPSLVLQSDNSRVTVALVTGFEPYNGGIRNPSGELAQVLDGATVGGATVVGRVLPVSAARTPDALRAAIDEVAPDLVVLVGLWPGRHAFQVERVALNVLDFPFPDNDGARPVDEPVLDGGPAALLARAPVRAVAEAWVEAGLPGAISNSAGTYVCNLSYYVALAHTEAAGTPVAFVHIPATIEQGAAESPPQPGLPLPTLLEGVRLAVATIAQSVPSPA